MKNKSNNLTEARSRNWEEKKFSRGSLPSGTIPSNGSDRISIRSVSKKSDRPIAHEVERQGFSFFLNGGHGSLRPNYTCRPGPGDQKLRQEVKGRECIVKLPLSKHSACSQVTTDTHDISIRLPFLFFPPRFQPRSLPPSSPLEELVLEVSAGNPKKWTVGFRRYGIARTPRTDSIHALFHTHLRTHVRALLEFPATDFHRDDSIRGIRSRTIRVIIIDELRDA